jgi:hypothetical protein
LKDCTCLGTILTSKNEFRPGIEKRIRTANRVYYAVLPLLKSQSLLRAEKIKISETVIRRVATYGAESWTLNKNVLYGWLLLKEKF